MSIGRDLCVFRAHFSNFELTKSSIAVTRSLRCTDRVLCSSLKIVSSVKRKENCKLKRKKNKNHHQDRIKHQMLVIVSAVQVDHAGQVLSQPQSRPGHQQVSNNDKYSNIYVVPRRNHGQISLCTFSYCLRCRWIRCYCWMIVTSCIRMYSISMWTPIELYSC